MTEFLPEGRRIITRKNRGYLADIKGMEYAMTGKEILEAYCSVCDSSHNLLLSLPAMKGIIPREEGALGITEGLTRDIALISRVGKAVCFEIEKIDRSGSEPVAVLSRRKPQQRAMDCYINNLQAGDIIPANITHLESFGAFCDIGCGIPSMIPIDAVSVSRINHPSDRFTVGDEIYAVVKGRDDGKILLTHKELLGTWQENADCFKAGETVSGVIRSVEDYGIFVELAPNLAGLAELKDDCYAGDCTTVYIKAIIPEKMKVKLIIVNKAETPQIKQKLNYTQTSGKIERWVYSTGSAKKKVETIF